MMTSLNLGASVVAMMMAAAIFSPRRIRRPEAGLATILFMTAIASAMITLQHGDVSSSAIDVFERIEFFLGFLVGPSLYLYVRREPLARRDLLHLIPTLLLLFGLPSIRLLMLQQFAYTGASAWVLYRDPARVELKTRLVAAFVAIHISQLIRLVFHDVAFLRNIVPTTVSLSVFFVAIAAFRSSILRAAAPKYSRSPLPDDADAILERLRKEIALVFTDPDLTLDTLAKRVDVPPHLVSRLLNDRLGTTFYDYVNRFRVDALCVLLNDRANDRYTIDALAERSGFASRSGFYAAFKRQKGMTPTAWRRHHVASASCRP